MRFIPVTDPSFAAYGRIVNGNFDSLLPVLAKTELPETGVVYEPSDAALEATENFKWFTDTAFGQMPVQLGYCNGHNRVLNALEFHSASEYNIACEDIVLILGLRQQIDPGTGCFDTDNAKAFLVPAGVMVEVYATTLHYAPCGPDGAAFHTLIALPKDTNLPLWHHDKGCRDDRMLRARNKWLLAHPDSPEASQGAFVGLVGENLTI